MQSIHRVQKYADISWLEARELLQQCPYTFRLLSDAANIEGVAEPIAYAYADAQRKLKEKATKNGQPTPRRSLQG